MSEIKFDMHAIQLEDITVTKLSLIVVKPKAALNFEGEINLKIEVGTPEFKEDNPNISVAIRIQAQPTVEEGSESPFTIEVDLMGHFKVDYSKFKYEHLKRWSKVNAPFLLLPYAREHIYGLGVRAGIRGLVVPLFIQPGTGPEIKREVAARIGNSTE